MVSKSPVGERKETVIESGLSEETLSALSGLTVAITSAPANALETS